MDTAIQQLRRSLSKTKIRVPVMWIRHQGISSADVFLASYPRSGSTWLRFLLNEILTGELSSFENVNRQLAFIGHHSHAPRLLPGGGRLIMTHEAYRKQYTRALYLSRDPRDVALSEYAFQKARGWIQGDFQTYLTEFLRGRVNGFGSWQSHVRSWLAAADASKGNIRVCRYDELRHAPEDSLAQLLDFLKVPVDARRIAQAVANNSLQEMRKKEAQSPQKVSKRDRFVRSGSVGGWREEFSPDQLRLVRRQLEPELARLGYAE
jgi:Sulfotransferase domain